MKISGIVVKGKSEGRILGFPTANVKSEALVNLANGVYLAETVYQGKNYQSLAVIGVLKPEDSFGANLEVWLDGFAGDLYGQQLIVEVGQKISDLVKVNSQEELIKKIKADVEKAEKLWERPRQAWPRQIN